MSAPQGRPSANPVEGRHSGASAPLVSIILPCYNEKAGIASMVREIKAALPGVSKEILIVDDNSPDGTAAHARAEFAGDPEVRVIVRTKDRGLARSIEEGLRSAAGSQLVVMDSDGNHQPKYLPFMIAALAHYDAVFGSRYIYGGRMSGRLRHNLSWAFNIFVRLATGGSIIDYLYGFFAVRRPVIERCKYDDIFWGYGDYCIRLLYALEAQAASLLQMPMINGERRGGRGNTAFLSVFAQYTVATLRLAATHKRLSSTWRG